MVRSKLNLFKEEQLTLSNLRNNKNIIIQKLFKPNSIAILDREKYLEGMIKVLNNNEWFESIHLEQNKELN